MRHWATPYSRFCQRVIFLSGHLLLFCSVYCSAYSSTRPHLSSPLKLKKKLSRSKVAVPSSSLIKQQQSPLLLGSNYNKSNGSRRISCTSLGISTVEVEDITVKQNEMSSSTSPTRDSDSLLSWKDIFPLSIYTAICLFGAIVVSTYEDFDVTHTRPNPSTLRLPTSSTISVSKSESKSANDDSGGVSWRNHFNFLGAATRGMGWGPSNRGILPNSSTGEGISNDSDFFEEWYGSSATTLQWKPSYNEIMLQHRSERVPRWNKLENNDGSAFQILQKSNVAVTSKEQLQQAVLQLYNSIDELDELKLMADDYMWEEMKERLNPKPYSAESKSAYSLPVALEYSMDILKSIPTYYASSAPDAPQAGDDANIKEVPNLIGFDWGSCAWRHCGAKADAQEAIAELQSSVGMLEPFECRFIIDIVERSIRDVLTVIPEDLKPVNNNGVPMQIKPYEPYVPRAGDDEEGLGIDYEYAQALSSLRVDLSAEE